MRTSTNFGGTHTSDISESVLFATEAEKLGVDTIWCAESWGMDAVSPLAFLAARTTRVQLGTGIMQISARRPATIAMTALTLAALSGHRFVLGLGVSGPQVVEGLHGVPFDRPLTRLRETIEVVQMAFRGETIRYRGQVYELPLPTAEAKALRLNLQPDADIPIYLGTLSPRSLRLTGELAAGWLGTSFVPSGADRVLADIEAGAMSAGRQLADVDIHVGGSVQFGSDLDELLEPRKRRLAFSMGAMGSAQHNFYNQAYQRAGYEAVAKEIQRLWLKGAHDDAVALVPDELVLQTSFVGTPEMVRDQFRAYRDAGATSLRLFPEGRNLQERLDTLGRALDLVRGLDSEPGRARATVGARAAAGTGGSEIGDNVPPNLIA
jgi:F420-dependent oxidoreductase-like protein